MTDKPRVRVMARSSSPKSFARDSFQNFAARVGLGTENQSTASTYGFNPVSRNRTLLEWMYREAWLVGQVVDVVAEDMTRAGIQINAGMAPDEIDKVQLAMQRLGVWEGLNDNIKWSRLYGGSIAVLLIDGQQLNTPLRIDTIKADQFKGLAILDRWMVQPSLNDLVKTMGPEMGDPKFYQVVTPDSALGGQTIHHSRVIRMEGVELPYWQKMAENGWGISVVERLFDRMVAFDSTTQGAAQLVYKAHLRTLQIDGLRDIIAAGGKVMEGLVKQLEMIRLYQSNEGLTVIDGKDTFATHTYTFTGLSDVLLQFGEQLSGASQIPLVRLFGQSPAGLNSTGESDLKTYHDNIVRQQERRLRRGLATILAVMSRSELEKPLDESFSFGFTPLTQMSEVEKSEVTEHVTRAVVEASDAGIINQPTAMGELRQLSRVTGAFSNIRDEDIKAAREAVDAEPAGAEGFGPDTEAPADGEEARPGKAADSAASFTLHGLDVVIETPKGGVRSGTDWSVVMPAHYGYIAGTWSAEGRGEEMDCFVGPNLASTAVWIIDQIDLTTGGFDEHKVMLGYSNGPDAARDYMAAFSDGLGFERMANMTAMSIDELKVWLRTGRLDRALAA